MLTDDKTPPQTPNGFITETVRAVLSQIQPPKKSFIKQVLDVWPLIVLGLSLIGAATTLYFTTREHVASTVVHFAVDGEGAKDSYARSEMLTVELKAGEEKLDKKLEIQGLKQELQLRKALSEFKDNYTAFKVNTAKMQTTVDADLGGQ